MDEYINREAVYEDFEKCNSENPKWTPSRVKTLISRQKAADVAPVRHGRWEWCKDYDGDSILVCSECGRVCHEEDAPYCYCGAKMDGGFDNG